MTVEPSTTLVHDEILPAPRDLSKLSLDELAALAISEHEACEAAMGEAVRHAIAVGEVLHHVAEREKQSGNYINWVRDNMPFGVRTAAEYRRFFIYRDRLVGVPSLGRGRVVLAGLPPIAKSGIPQVDEETKRAALEMLADGMTQADVAAVVGVSAKTVRCWINPEKAREIHRRDQRRRAAAARALREQEKRKERDRLAKDAGGEAAKAYSAIRKTLAAIDAALTVCDDRTEREHLTSALRAGHKTEDAIVEALKAHRLVEPPT